MSDPVSGALSIAGLMSGAGNVLGGIGNAAGGIFNYFSQKDTLAQQQAQYQQSRWDAAHAVETRAADMQAAGINPLLAAGSPATAMTPPHLDAPQLDPSTFQGMSQAFSGPMEALRNSADVGGKLAQIDAINAQARKANADAALTEAVTPFKSTSAEMQANFDQATLPSKIALVSAQVDNTQARTLLTNADEALARSNLDLNKLDQVYRVAQTKLTGVQTTNVENANKIQNATYQNAQLDTTAKAAAIVALNYQNEFLAAIQKYHPGDLEGWQKILNLVKTGTGAVKDIASSISGFLP